MRRLAIYALALAAFGAAGCDDDDGPNNPSSQPIVFTAQLSAANEVPAIWNAESSAQGTATITFTVPRDASGNITGAGTWNVQAVLTGFTADSAIRLAHIHTGASGVAGPIYVNTGLTAATQIALVNGAGTINIANIDISQELAQTVTNNPAGHYFNMHSPLNPGGAVRGQLVRVQ